MGKLYLICGDYILNSNDMDAIVNAANKYMINGSGICGAIYKASGIELLEYCKQNFKENMVSGEVRITRGFHLNMDIIHVLAPKYFEENEPIKSLMICYKNLLEKIKEKKYKKIEALKLYKMCINHMLFSYANRKICLKDLVECKSSNISLSDIEFNNGKYPIYGANGIIKCISSFDFENNYIGIIKDGSGVGKTIICEKFSSLLATMNALIPIKQENIFYINELIKQINFNKYIVGSGIPHIYFRDYCNEQLYIHENESILKIGKYIEDIDEKIKLEEKNVIRLSC